MLVDKDCYDAGAAVEVVQNLGALHHVVKILPPITVVELLQKILLKRLAKLL
jgi:hypothetical protein